MPAMGAQWTKLGRTGVVIAFAGTLVAFAGTLVACSPSPIPTPSPELRIVTSNSSEPSGMEALLNGSLTVDDEGCVLAQTSGSKVTLVWPHGYSVRGDSASYEIIDRNGEVVAKSGEELAIGGGGSDEPDDSWGNAGCVAGDIWIVGGVRPA